MARPGETDDAFIREVDEAYQRERLANLWSRYGRWILMGVGLFLVALAAFLWWREEQARQAGRHGEQFLQALARLDSGQAAAAEPVLKELAASDAAGYRALAKLSQAAVATQGGDTARALALYREVSSDEKLAQPYRELATLKAIRLEYDKLPVAKLIEQLRPLAQAGSPWFGSAGEMLAIAYMRDGKPELAGPLFAAIAKDAGVPPTLRVRASQMATMLGAEPAPAAAPNATPTEARP